MKLKYFFEQETKFFTPEKFENMVKELKQTAQSNNKPIKESLKEYDGAVGRNSHLTANMDCNLSVAYLRANIKGALGESHGFKLRPGKGYYFGNYPIKDWYKLVKNIAENSLKNPIFIIVDYNKEPVISEGNHRLEAFRQLGLKTIPCEIRFFGMAQNNFNDPGRYEKHLKKKIEELR